MQPNQPNDPNKTVLGASPMAGDPNRTQAMPGGLAGMGGANVTRAMSAADLQRTTMMQAPSQGLSVQVTASRDVSMANGPAREQFLIELSAGLGASIPGYGGMAASGRTPMNLCLVIDRSGSMEGPPLEYVKQACHYVVDMLTPNDVLSIVTFEEVVEVLMPPQRVTNKELIKQGVSRLVPGNTTNLYDGLSLGVQQLLQTQDAARATRMIVLTDGDPTAGIKDFSALVNHAGEVKNRGISATFLGFGPDYNEELLAGMAKRAGGSYYYIPQPQMIPEVFRSELEKLMTTVARNLVLEVKLSRWVSMRSPQTVPQGTVTIPLADMERGTTLQQVLDLEFGNHPLGWYRVAAGKLMYEDLESGSTKTVDIDMVMEFTADSARYSVPPNPKVSQAYQVAAASKVVEKTVMGLKTGVLTAMGAIQELQKTQMLLVSEGRTAEAQEVTMALRALQSGDTGQAEKTLMGTALHLEQGKKNT